MVFKKCRANPDDILFIDASGYYDKAKNQNVLSDAHVDKIVATYRNRQEEAQYSHVATMAEVEGNDWNLNIPRYVDTFEEEARVDLDAVLRQLKAIQADIESADSTIASFCAELGLEAPQ